MKCKVENCNFEALKEKNYCREHQIKFERGWRKTIDLMWNNMEKVTNFKASEKMKEKIKRWA